jgi:hypothetical protein
MGDRGRLSFEGFYYTGKGEEGMGSLMEALSSGKRLGVGNHPISSFCSVFLARHGKMKEWEL